MLPLVINLLLICSAISYCEKALSVKFQAELSEWLQKYGRQAGIQGKYRKKSSVQ